MTYKLSIFVPITTISNNNLLRLHPFKRDKYNKAWEKMMHAHTYKLRPDAPLKRFKLEFERVSNYLIRDYDNLTASFKPVADALKKCCIIEDDSIKNTGAWGIHQRFLSKSETGSHGTRITVVEESEKSLISSSSAKGTRYERNEL